MLKLYWNRQVLERVTQLRITCLPWNSWWRIAMNTTFFLFIFHFKHNKTLRVPGTKLHNKKYIIFNIKSDGSKHGVLQYRYVHRCNIVTYTKAWIQQIQLKIYAPPLGISWQPCYILRNNIHINKLKWVSHSFDISLEAVSIPNI